VTTKAKKLAEARSQITKWREHPAQMVRELFHVEPDPWQEEALEAFPHHQRIALLASKGPGKAQPRDTLIPLPNGKRRNIGSLDPGDEVFAGDGTITRVRAVHDRGILPVYRVTFDDGSSTITCGEHLWRIKGDWERRHKTWAILSTEQIIARGIRKKNGRWAERHFEIPRQGPAQFHERDLPLDPYFLGVWLGDGVRLKPNYHAKPDIDISAEIERRGMRIRHSSDDSVTVYGQAAGLKACEVWPLYSYERFVPGVFKTAQESARRDVLCGLMDTDGTIGTDGHMEFTSTSRQLAEDVVWLARSLGGVAFLKEAVKEPFYYGNDGRKILGRLCYRVTVVVPFNPFHIKRKAARWKDPSRSPSTIRYMTRKLDRIEPAGLDYCCCIEVEHESGLYLTNDFIVTHNTATLAWLGWNFLLTRRTPKVIATSITGENLADNLWTEMAKWQAKADLLQRMFVWTKTRIFAKDHPETWWMAARAWPQSGDREKQANTLAGYHEDYILFLLDESGDIPLGVMAAAEPALSSCIEGHIVQAGNPTDLHGPLYEAHTKRHRWHVIEINGDPDNPNRSPRVSAEWARQYIEDHGGRDDPWVRVNVLGQFPRSALNALVTLEEIETAMNRVHRDYDIGDAALVLGVDVARFGDDASVIFPRRGIQAFNPTRHRNLDSTQGAAIVNRLWNSTEADAVFIDNTGGFGAGWIDQLRLMHKAPIGIGFAEAAHDAQKYANRRAEMYYDAAQWIKGGGGLPRSREMVETFTRTTYTFVKGSRLLIEPKEDIKAKLGYSPDEADAFVLTFAEPISPGKRRGISAKPRHTFEHDPYASLDSNKVTAYNQHRVNYDPF
jgi:phage terminase large subunit